MASNKRRTAVAVACLVWVLGTGVADAGWLDLPHESVIKSLLRDPESAQFTQVRHFKCNGDDYTYGEVNSRNGFGGYVGAKQFVTRIRGNKIQVIYAFDRVLAPDADSDASLKCLTEVFLPGIK